MIYIILSVIAGALGLYYIFKDLDFFKKHGVPHKPPIPVFGNMGPSVMCRQFEGDLIKELYNLNPETKYIGIFDMNVPVVLLRDPELIKSITIKHFETFPDRCFMGENQDPLLGKALFTLRGDKWRQIRALLRPTFTPNKMKSMFKLISDRGIEFTNYLAQLPPEQRIMETTDVFMRYINDVIATCAFGVNVDSMRDPKNQFYLYGKEMAIPTVIKLYIFKYLPWLARLIKLKYIRQEIVDFLHNLIENTIKTRDENGIVRPDMLQLMMENRDKEDKTKLSVEDMVAQAFIFFFAGFDTTSTAVCFAAHEITVNQDVQEKFQKEIDQVLEDTNGQASYEAINGMEYLDAIINETLRMYPVIATMNRLSIKDFELPPALPGLKPFPIKKGQELWISVYELHNDPKYFEEPEKFDPERFLGERKKDTLNCGAYIPFGLGPRMCIANRFALLETKVLLFHLLARCDLKPCEKTSIPLKLVKNGQTVYPKGGFWLEVSPRKNIHHTLAAKLVNGTH